MDLARSRNFFLDGQTSPNILVFSPSVLQKIAQLPYGRGQEGDN